MRFVFSKGSSFRCWTIRAILIAFLSASLCGWLMSYRMTAYHLFWIANHRFSVGSLPGAAYVVNERHYVRHSVTFHPDAIFTAIPAHRATYFGFAVGRMPATRELDFMIVPFWFLSSSAAMLLLVAWRKTKPNFQPTEKAFPLI